MLMYAIFRRFPGSEEARNRVLEVIQCWAHGFRDKPQYRIAQDTVNLMKLEGYKFPVMREADALFVAESAPDWVDGDCCHRCRSDFSLTNRKHHCRNCGQIFCSKCSGKVSPLPHFGIEKEVRVCDSCYDSINGPKTATTSGATGQKEGKENDLPVEYLNSALSKVNIFISYTNLFIGWSLDLSFNSWIDWSID